MRDCDRTAVGVGVGVRVGVVAGLGGIVMSMIDRNVATGGSWRVTPWLAATRLRYRQVGTWKWLEVS